VGQRISLKERGVNPMVKSFDIFFGDLVPETQKEVLKSLSIKRPTDGNFDIFPLTTVCRKDVEEFNEEVKKRDKSRSGRQNLY